VAIRFPWVDQNRAGPGAGERVTISAKTVSAARRGTRESPYVAFSENDTGARAQFANARARATAWPQVLDYLRRLAS
jgi:hypothetical protein